MIVSGQQSGCRVGLVGYSNIPEASSPLIEAKRVVQLNLTMLSLNEVQRPRQLMTFNCCEETFRCRKERLGIIRNS